MKILDASTIIAFYSELHQPNLLHEFINLGHELFIPKEVFEDIKRGTRTISLLNENIVKGNIKIMQCYPEEDLRKFLNRYPSLHKGESEVILWGLKFKASNEVVYCILDEKHGREVALKQGLTITGTLGLLEMLHKKEKLNFKDYQTLLKRLTKAGFRI